MGLSGLGSMDVTTTSGPPPVVTARVYTDNGPDAGTFGFYEDLIAPGDALHGGDAASFTLPGDTANFRVNVGVRTLGAGAQISVNYYEPSGGAIQGQTQFKSYAANYFEQVGISAFVSNNNIINLLNRKRPQTILSVIATTLQLQYQHRYQRPPHMLPSQSQHRHWLRGPKTSLRS